MRSALKVQLMSYLLCFILTETTLGSGWEGPVQEQEMERCRLTLTCLHVMGPQGEAMFEVSTEGNEQIPSPLRLWGLQRAHRGCLQAQRNEKEWSQGSFPCNH